MDKSTTVLIIVLLLACYLNNANSKIAQENGSCMENIKDMIEGFRTFIKIADKIGEK